MTECENENNNQELYKNLAWEFKLDYEQCLEEIKTFESIFCDKRFSDETKKLAREILKNLYTERDENAKKAEFYREIYKGAEGTQRFIGWGSRKIN